MKAKTRKAPIAFPWKHVSTMPIGEVVFARTITGAVIRARGFGEAVIKYHSDGGKHKRMNGTDGVFLKTGRFVTGWSHSDPRMPE